MRSSLKSRLSPFLEPQLAAPVLPVVVVGAAYVIVGIAVVDAIEIRLVEVKSGKYIGVLSLPFDPRWADNGRFSVASGSS